MQLLIIEDNALDVERIERTLAKLETDASLICARDGEEALDRLYGRNGCEPIDPPDGILLDLNMPRMNGGEFLKAFRADPSWFNTPVFVLTTSDRNVEVRESISNGANGYTLKPIGPMDLTRALDEMHAAGSTVAID